MSKPAHYIFLFFILFIAGCTSQAPEEASNLTDPDEKLIYFNDYLNSEIENWNQNLGIDFHIVVINKSADDIVAKAQTIFQKRKIGDQAKTGGVLILVNPVTRQARIAVSHNLEAIFTDDIVGAIAKSQLSPYASYNMAGMAIMDTMHFLKDHLLAHVAQGTFELDSYYRDRPGNKTILGYYSGGGGASTNIPEIKFNDNWKQKPATTEMTKYLPGTTPEESINAYSNALRDMVGYPDLQLLTDGSKIMQRSYPFAPYESYLRYLRTEQSRPLTIEIQGDRAVALSANPAHGYHPIMLRQVKGKWHIDQAEMMKNMFFDGSGNFYQKNRNHPYHFALKNKGDKGSYAIAAKTLPPSYKLQTTINALKAEEVDGMRTFLIAELLFKNAFAAMESLEYYEKAVELEPENDFYRKKLIKRYQYLGMDSLAIKHAMYIDEYRKYMDDPLKVQFIPYNPTFNIGAPTKVGDVTVYDHSEFGIKITNRHFLPMRLFSVDFNSIGDKDGHESGLGNILSYWNFGDKAILGANRTISFNKVWGFTTDTPNEKMTYEYIFTYIIGNNPEFYTVTKRLVLTPADQVL